LCIIKSIKKYLFSLLVLTYFVPTIGVPIYLHYCGGELEKINYLVNTRACCDGEDEEQAEATNGCCKNEQIVLINGSDFTFDSSYNYKFSQKYTQCFCAALPVYSQTKWDNFHEQSNYSLNFLPQKLVQSLLVCSSVLLI
jgi:hypothetical protein